MKIHKRFHHCRVYALISFLVLNLLPLGVQAAGPTAEGTVEVSGKICVANPVQPVIGVPTDQEVFENSIITVSGTATANEPIMLHRNRVDVGSTVADPTGAWEFEINLDLGSNQLIAEGCFDSAPVTVYWQPPVPPAPPTVPGVMKPASPSRPGNLASPAGSQAAPVVTYPLLSISVGRSQIQAKAGQEMTLAFKVTGGLSPYSYDIDWGDGSVTHDTLKHSGSVGVHHTYAKKAQYSVKITLQDAAGNLVVQSLLVTVTDPPGVLGSTTPSNFLPASVILEGMLAVLVFALWELMHRRHKRRHEHYCPTLFHPVFRS